ncbi:6-phospho-alpha-glucosidase [Streptococcus equi]|uniref:6-phospho-beta-glucosidase n=1 Tax=Streptococcus equi subsp. zooepidemicus TaxID=40041 RepID=A0AAJ1UTU0_STRSZ|nr:6-phospho-alpha-glucosidase [Streptococcus equi]MCD3397952.1 6-phospho-alpha-glucosidase [Streptococcus equi subsp. zooepidemicus]MCD3408009.1 6-phospho-alpha-glucosidase [Streptococcus equi subsp. zooepidemicus]MCD3428257.1 6-phospho-alpha-glucosidase [Streptococcus equi subsp. zooepidemicus]MDI5900823.1 6-phospho-alpha-glucosidase [Streptococcus equi subsp. zooepidemicus]MDI5918692.1 6-phospho-alpha-glucosidase [Streptococcus equi subsp. zooepidemicus]
MGHKFVMVGGGSTQSPGILEVLRQRSEELRLTDLVLYDIDEERVSLLGQYTKMYYAETGSTVNVSYTTDIDEAFTGADYLFMQIRPGLNRQRAIDEKICIRNGVVGQETCGLGGFSFAMRVIPAVMDIIRKVKELCPNAWILNYTNPEAILSEAIYREFPEAKVLCICDMPISIEGAIAKYFNKDLRDLTFKYFGLNHFGWWTNIYDENGNDLLPILREDVVSGKIDTLLQSNEETKADQYWIDTYKQMISLFKRFPDYFPNCYLQYYLTPDEMLAHDDVNFTRGDYVIQGREKRIYEECRRVIASGTAKNSSLHAGVHGNYIVDIAYSIIHNTRERFTVNKKNHGAISNFDPEAVVEVPAYVGSMGAETINIGSIPPLQKGLMEMQKAYEKKTVDAALTGSYQTALEAVMLNKTIPNYTVGKKVLDELYEANKDFWPVLK